MKNIVISLLLAALLVLFTFPASAELPHASAYYKAVDITPLTEERCSMTLQLRDGSNTITRSGVYLVQGSCVGQLIIDAEEADVYLYFSGVSIISPDGPAIHIKAADKVVITLAEGSENTLKDSVSFSLPQGEDEPNGALFSKEDLSINGTGTLYVTAQYDDGIVSKDSLVIANANVIINSKGDAIRGKDSVMLYHTAITATAGNDGIKSTNAEDDGRGWIYILDSALTIKAQHDGIQAETDLFISGGTYSIASGGGCLPEYRQTLAEPVRKADQGLIPEEDENEVESETESGKGIKAADIHIGSGTFAVNSRDDAIHANGSITILDGVFELASNDDGIHADDFFELTNGHVLITECYEGIEASHILLQGGKTDVTAIDDGWNAASKAVSEAESDLRKKSHNFDITVSGGEHTILAGTDAIDSNGSILISGGVTLASSSNEMKEVPIDYPVVCECRITGGILAASGGYGKNTQTFSHSENQASVTLKWKEQQPAGTTVRLLSDDGEVLLFVPKAPFKTIIVSAPALQVGKMLTVQTDADGSSSRKIEENIMFFPVAQNKQAENAAQNSESTQEAQAPLSYGTLIEQPASGSSLGYLLYKPRPTENDALPLIVYLHGGGSKGSDLSLLTASDGFPQYVVTGRLGDVGAYVLMPQCPEDNNGWLSIKERVFSLIDEVCARFPVDTQHIILTGHSMGGTGTWALAAIQPERFSCIVPMSGSVKISNKNLQALSELSIWVFVAENDKVVSPDSSTDFVSQLTSVNPDVRLTVFEGAGHRDVPSLAWLDENASLLDWMLSK